MAANTIYEWAQSQPEKAALIQNGFAFNYAALARGIEASRQFLQMRSLPVGKTAIVLATSIADSWVIVHALRSLGLTTIGVPNIAAAHDLKIRDVACVVTTQSELTTQQLRESDLKDLSLLVIPNATYASIFNGDVPRPIENAPPLGGHILYTSGTTGTYKKVLMAGACEKARNEARANSQGYGIDAIDHGIGFGIWSGAGFKQPSAIWHAGGTQIIDQRPDAADHFFENRFTKTGALPIFLESVLKRRSERNDHLPPPFDFEFSHSGGFMTKRLADQIIKRITRHMLVVYSATEFIRVPLKSKYQTVDDLHWMKPVPGSVVEIVDENDAPCAAHEEGHVRVLLTDVDATGYLDDPGTTAKFFRHGYFYPGDIGVRREDGAIRILGRSADVLNVRGSKMAVAPLEQKVQDILQVEAVCLFSGLDKAGVEELVVMIEGDKAPSGEEMRRIASGFPQFERLRFEMMKKFPRTEAGMQKIKRTELRKLAFASHTDQGDAQ